MRELVHQPRYLFIKCLNYGSAYLIMPIPPIRVNLCMRSYALKLTFSYRTIKTFPSRQRYGYTSWTAYGVSIYGKKVSYGIFIRIRPRTKYFATVLPNRSEWWSCCRISHLSILISYVEATYLLFT